MKLNNGRGWESTKQSQGRTYNPEPNPDQSARAMHSVAPQGGRPGRDARAGISSERLNQAQPPTPGSPAQPGAAVLGKNARDRTSGYGGGNLPKRTSGLAGQVDVGGTPTASTQAQFQTSQANLNSAQARQTPATGALQSSQRAPPQQQEQSSSWVKKLFACCGM